MLVFKNVATETTSITQQLTIFGKTFADIKKDLHNGLGIKSFSSTVTSKDVENLRNFNKQINNGVKYKTAFDENLSSSSIIVKRQANELIGLNKQLKTLQTLYSQGNINQSEYRTQVQATQEKITALTTQTQTLTLKQRLLAGATQMAVMAFNMLKMIAVTAIVTGIIAGITKVVNRQKELTEQIKEIAGEAKQTSTELSNLYNNYLELSQAVADGTGSKDDLTSATDELLKALGLEGIAVDNLIDKYGSLSDAISTITIESLKNAHNDLVASVDTYKDELLKAGKSGLGMKNSYELTDYSTVALDDGLSIDDYIDEYNTIVNIMKKIKGIQSSFYQDEYGDRYIFNLLGDTDTIDGIVQNYEALIDVRENLVSSLGSERAGQLDLYKNINSHINELKTAYENYTNEVTTLNQNAAKTAVLESLKGKELPKTEKEFKQFYKNLISEATTTGTTLRNQFIGSEKDIKNSIESTLESMSIFDEFTIKDPVEAKIEIIPTVTTDVSALKSNLEIVKGQIEDTFKNTNLFDKAIESINDGKAIDFNDVLSMIEIDNSLAGKFTKTADGYTIAVEDLTKSRQEYIKTTKDSIQADITSAKASINTAEQNISSYQKQSDMLVEASKHDNEAYKQKEQLDNAIKTEQQNIEDANNVIEQNTLLLDELNGSMASVSSTAEEVSKKVKLITTVMSDMNDEGYISSSTYDELQEMGGNFTECLEIQNGKLVVNIQKLKELEAQEYKNIKAHKQALLDAYGKITVSRKADGLDTSFIDEQMSNLQTEIAYYQTLIDEIYSAGDDTEDKNKKEFDKLYSEKQHQLEMNQITEEDYIDWLDDAYKQYFSDLTKYQDEYWKYEEEVYKWRTEQEQKLFDKKIDNYEKLADKALEDNVDADGNKLELSLSFDYAREQLTNAITELQQRINDIRTGVVSGTEDDIEQLKEDIDSLNDKLKDIDDKEVTAERDFLKDKKDEYSDFYDEQIDKLKEQQDEAEKLADQEKEAIQAKIDLLEEANSKKSEEIDLEKKRQELEKAKSQHTIARLNADGTTSYVADAEKINDAQEEYDNAKYEYQKSLLEAQIKVIEKAAKEQSEKYDDQIKLVEKQKKMIEEKFDALIKPLDDFLDGDKQTASNTNVWDMISKISGSTYENGVWSDKDGNAIDINSLVAGIDDLTEQEKEKSKQNSEASQYKTGSSDTYELLAKYFQNKGMTGVTAELLEKGMKNFANNGLAFKNTVPNLLDNTAVKSVIYNNSRHTENITNNIGDIIINNPVGSAEDLGKEILKNGATIFSQQTHTNRK